jgi:hypothetical protein
MTYHNSHQPWNMGNMMRQQPYVLPQQLPSHYFAQHQHQPHQQQSPMMYNSQQHTVQQYYGQNNSFPSACNSCGSSACNPCGQSVCGRSSPGSCKQTSCNSCGKSSCNSCSRKGHKKEKKHKILYEDVNSYEGHEDRSYTFYGSDDETGIVIPTKKSVSKSVSKSESRSHSKHESSSCNKCRHHKCKCVEWLPCIETRCGPLSASLTKSANPTFYTAVGNIITYTYRITNTGCVSLCYPLQICDDKLGGMIVPPTFIPPGTSHDFTRTYVITAADLLVTSITNTAAAFFQVKECKFLCTQASSSTITFGANDLFGSIVQTTIEGGARVTVNIVNNSTSLTAAQNVKLFLNWPPGVTSVTNPTSTPPDTNVVGPPVSITSPTIAIGATRVFTFDYTAPAGTYTWSGTITSSTFETDPSNNFISSTFTIP